MTRSDVTDFINESELEAVSGSSVFRDVTADQPSVNCGASPVSPCGC